ncbi:oligosaccharide flippase family protein [Aeribacillus alveayuensis]|uniref:O-antigen/teichoic acid export membrane protein n=1 Tax=Aeribacillus alveayuensis TaxID=279215 RepID=A0ABT9VNS4_9BACI|nr:O-antigen/teichoic acid export membrane protein [Bacillus alveayuensis]
MEQKRILNKQDNMFLGAGLSFVGRVLSSLLGYFSLIITVKIVGAFDFGLYNIALSIIAFVNILSVFGFENSLLRYIPLWKQKGKQYLEQKLNLSIAFVILLSFVFTLLLIFVSFPIGNLYNSFKLKYALIIMGLSITFNTFIVVSRAINQAFFYYRRAIVPEDFIRPISMFILLVILWTYSYFTGEQLNFLLIAVLYFFNTILSFVYAIKTLRLTLKEEELKFSVKLNSFKLERELIQYTFYTFSITLILQFSYTFTVLILGMILSPTEVGYLSLSLKTVSFVSFILIAVNKVFGPRIADLYAKNQINELHKLYKETVRWILTFGTPICLWLVLESKNILHFFGTDFVKASASLIILSIGEFVNIAVGSVGYILMMSGNAALNLKVNIFSLIATIILTIVLTPILGVNGSAIAISSGVILTNLLNLMFVRKMIGILPYSKKQYTIVASIILNIFFYWFISNTVIHNMIISMISIFIIHLVIVIVFGLNKIERRMILNFLKNSKLRGKFV